MKPVMDQNIISQLYHSSRRISLLLTLVLGFVSDLFNNRYPTPTVIPYSLNILRGNIFEVEPDFL